MSEGCFLQFFLAHRGKLNFADVGSAVQGGGGEQAEGGGEQGSVCRSWECSSRGTVNSPHQPRDVTLTHP